MRMFILSLFYFISLVIFLYRKLHEISQVLDPTKSTSQQMFGEFLRVLDPAKFTYQDEYKITTTSGFSRQLD